MAANSNAIAAWIDSAGDGLALLVGAWFLVTLALVLLVSAVLSDDQEDKPEG